MGINKLSSFGFSCRVATFRGSNEEVTNLIVLMGIKQDARKDTGTP